MWQGRRSWCSCRAHRAQLQECARSLERRVLAIGSQQDQLRLVSWLAEIDELDVVDGNGLDPWVVAVAKRAQIRDSERQLQIRLQRLMEARIDIESQAIVLLCDAADGKLNLEALTYLQAAWGRLEDRLDEHGLTSTFHLSTWLVATAAHALPDEPEVVALADRVLRLTEGKADEALQALKESPENAGDLFRTVLFASLARGTQST